jgi:hypothetical protein
VWKYGTAGIAGGGEKLCQGLKDLNCAGADYCGQWVGQHAWALGMNIRSFLDDLPTI